MKRTWESARKPMYAGVSVLTSGNPGGFALHNSKANSIAGAAVIVMSSIVISRLTGFIRETMLSWKVGLSWVQDAYIAAFTIPDLMYALLVGGTISAALVPFLSGSLEQKQEQEGWKAVSSFINTVFAGMVLLCILGVIFAPVIIPAVVPGFDENSPETKELAIRLSRILFPSVSFIMLAGICNGILNSYKKFAAAAYGPSIYNIGSALSIYFFAGTNTESMTRVAVGVAASAMIYFIIQLSFSLPKFKLYRFVIDIYDKGYQKLVKQAIPSLMSSSVTNINMIVSKAFVSLSAMEGSLTAFYNANTTWQLPYGIFAMGIGTAMLPTLSGKFAAREYGEYKSILMKSLTSVLFFSVPSAAAFILLRKPVVRAIFMWGGKFSESSVPIVSSILAMFSLAMVSQSIVAIMNRAFYARQDTKTPLFIGLSSVALNFCFGIIFYRFTNLGAAGMALSYSIISTVNSTLLLILLNKKMNGIQLNKLYRFFTASVPAALIMCILLYILEMLPVCLDTKMLQLSYLAFEIITGAAVYITIMILLKSEEAFYFLKSVKKKVNLL